MENNGYFTFYEWYFKAFGDWTLIEPGMGEFSGQGTPTLNVLTPAGMDLYCLVTSPTGSKVKSGVWRVGTAYCP